MEHDGRGAMNIARSLNKEHNYRVFLTQTGINNPVVFILKDTIEDVIVTRSTVGTTLFTKLDGFPMSTSVPKK